ncbi:MAG: peptide synthase [Litorilinea sp.]|nr:MAG: peptide synthase [Litorilinea sp.]
MNLAELLSQQARHRPQAIALLDLTRGRLRQVRFAQLDEWGRRGASLLAREGLQAGDVILIFHPLGVELYAALAAVLRMGLVAMFVDPAQGTEHIARCCQLLPPKALLATPKAHLLRLTTPALRRIPVKFATGLGAPGAIPWRRWRSCAPSSWMAPCSPDTPALVTFTSGTTGQPKATVRTHGILLQQHLALERTLGLTPDDRVLTTLPLFVLSHLAAGASTLLPRVNLRSPGRVDGPGLVAQMERHRVTCLEGSPTLVDGVVRACEAQGRILPGLTRVFSGGAPVFPQLMARVQAVAPQATVTAVYGATEAEPIAAIHYHELDEDDIHQMQAGAGLLAGRPVPEICVRILPDRWGTPWGSLSPAEFEELTLPPGVPGEIVVSGRYVLTGYLHGQGDAETKIRVGETIWHRTGDAGYLDHEGRLWLLGRCAARVADARGVLYPLSVEAPAQAFPQVRRAALVAHAGQRLLALELDGPPTPTLLQQIHTQVGRDRIDKIWVLPRLPVDRRHNAKIDYGELRQLLIANQKTAAPS